MLSPRPSSRKLRQSCRENFGDRRSVGWCEVTKRLRLIRTAQNLAEAPIDVLLRRCGHLPEGLGIDQITQRITEQSSSQIEIPERSAAAVPWTLPAELRSKI